MPVRIYDISKKLGLENKEVLNKAEELGIAAARVASRSLDKITAEYLEQQLIVAHPERAMSATVTPSVPQQVHEPVVLVMQPTPATETEQKEESATATATAVMEDEPPVDEVAPAPAAEAPAPPTSFIAPPPPVEPEPPKAPPGPPPPPPSPKVGDKVGFIQLPQKPVAKPPEKPAAPKLPQRPQDSRTDFAKRGGDIRGVR